MKETNPITESWKMGKCKTQTCSMQECQTNGKEYEDIILPPPEQFRDGYKPIPKPRTDRLPLPPTPNHKFNFDDDIFHAGNQSLEKFKKVAYKARKIRNSKATQTNSKLKSLRSWTTLKRYITYSKN